MFFWTFCKGKQLCDLLFTIFGDITIPNMSALTLLGIDVCFNPIALRLAKTLWSFGLSECNRVKGRTLLVGELILPFKKGPLSRGEENENDRVAVPESIFIFTLTLLHSERPNLCTIFAFLSAIGLKLTVHTQIGVFMRASVFGVHSLEIPMTNLM